jgi:hypothetical protein
MPYIHFAIPLSTQALMAIFDRIFDFCFSIRLKMSVMIGACSTTTRAELSSQLLSLLASFAISTCWALISITRPSISLFSVSISSLSQAFVLMRLLRRVVISLGRFVTFLVAIVSWELREDSSFASVPRSNRFLAISASPNVLRRWSRESSALALETSDWAPLFEF